jgi:hypothetical protein
MPDAELVRLTERQSMSVVDPAPFRGVKGISVLPNANGRAFLALQNGQGIADLELAISDRLEADAVPRSERDALTRVREQVKEWRRSPSWRVESKSIILISAAEPGRCARKYEQMDEIDYIFHINKLGVICAT